MAASLKLRPVNTALSHTEALYEPTALEAGDDGANKATLSEHPLTKSNGYAGWSKHQSRSKCRTWTPSGLMAMKLWQD